MNLFRLPTCAIVLVTGADRVSFLQGQLTQDVAALTPATALAAAHLTPPGRVLAIARLIARDDTIVLLVPAELAVGLAERLRRYVLRAKVKVALAGNELVVAAVLAGSPGEIDARFGGGAAGGHQRLENGVSLVRLGRRALLIGSATALAPHLDAADDAGAAAWELAAIRAGQPAVLAATSETWTPQMLNLDLIGAISFTKGCYTGQEIVARTQHLGRIKRRMFRYVAENAVSIAPGEPLTLAGVKVGEVVRSGAAGTATELLAVVSLESREQPLESARGTRFAPAPLPYAVG